jgi:hypothetical protein
MRFRDKLQGTPSLLRVECAIATSPGDQAAPFAIANTHFSITYENTPHFGTLALPPNEIRLLAIATPFGEGAVLAREIIRGATQAALDDGRSNGF